MNLASKPPTSLQAWIFALRLPTLPLSLAAAICGHVAAWQHGFFSTTIAFLGVLTAVLLQILSNLANDYGDATHQTDNAQRLGPPRMVSSGYISPTSMKKGMAILVLLILFSGSLLLTHTASTNHRHFWVLWLIGAAAIWAAIAYTVGKKPYGYLGAGDFAVFIFFGLVAVQGSFYLQSGQLQSTILPLSAAIGLWCSAVLNINNMRDRENDIQYGKITIAARLGQNKMRHYHSILIIGAAILWIFYVHLTLTHQKVLILLLPTMFFSIIHLYIIYHQAHAKVFNCQLKILSLFVLFQVALLGLVWWV